MLRCYLRAVLPPPRSSLSEDVIAVFVAIEEEARALGATPGVTLEALAARTLLAREAILGAVDVLANAGMIRVETVENTAEHDAFLATDERVTVPNDEAAPHSEMPETVMPMTTAPMTSLPSTTKVPLLTSDANGQAAALFAVEFASLSIDERMQAARNPAIDTLDALVLDPALQVRDALLEHRGIPARILARLVSSYTIEQACIRARRPLPETTKAAFADAVRAYYVAANADERHRFLVATDGSALPLLTGVPFDVATTQKLVADPALSPPLVRALADFTGSPPGLVTYLAGLPIARSQMSVREALLAHPNLSPSRKRALSES